ncbi:glycosyl transferase, family 2 [Magnetococcus marinus MC-1]|uniref:Glycosyl transferase, family 2 n=1 Tax=Magnetococcus marinus (strain ATCC BAA-1437 / JCM 17883 / MC-1) TaxID=156889 RepID=A0L922_MAGMM|nr:glycosyltransferase family 2 protein [Magnetococcus marinus]ABK44465.1 glycosyl transferase, family 2 [Magnetococcus marinus MC-1]
MKLIVQIPCFNEARTLGQTVADIPREIPGISSVELLVIDDGSSDNTSEVAAQLGVEHIVRSRRNRGLAATFQLGLNTALEKGADIIVNSDGDNQYCGADIPKLIEPILSGRADVVVGTRDVSNIEHFSPIKKMLSKFGSRVVGRIIGLPITDAVSGFRAMSRSAAQRLEILSTFSYTLEMLFQIQWKGLALETVAIRTNAPLRHSRLFKSVGQFIGMSVSILLRVQTLFHPLRTFIGLGFILLFIGSAPVIRFLWLYLQDPSSATGHVQSLIIGGVLINLAIISWLLGVLADLIGFNRKLHESGLERLKQLESRLISLEKTLQEKQP